MPENPFIKELTAIQEAVTDLDRSVNEFSKSQIVGKYTYAPAGKNFRFIFVFEDDGYKISGGTLTDGETNPKLSDLIEEGE